MPPPPHGMPPYKPPYQQQSGQPHQPQYLPNQMYMQHPRPGMGSAGTGVGGGPNPYGSTGSYGSPQQQQLQPPPQQQQSGGGLPPNSTNSPMPPASPGPNRSIPPHMGPPTPYSGYPSGKSRNSPCQQALFMLLTNFLLFYAYRST